MGICSAKRNRGFDEQDQYRSNRPIMQIKSTADIDKSSSSSRDANQAIVSSPNHSKQHNIALESDSDDTPPVENDTKVVHKPDISRTKARVSHKMGTTPSPQAIMKGTKHRQSSRLLPNSSLSESLITPKPDDFQSIASSTNILSGGSIYSGTRDASDSEFARNIDRALIEDTHSDSVKNYAGLRTPKGNEIHHDNHHNHGPESVISPVYPHDFEDHHTDKRGHNPNGISFDSDATYAKKEQLQTPRVLITEFGKMSNSSSLDNGRLDSDGNVLIHNIYGNQRDRNLSMTGHGTPYKMDEHLIPQFPSGMSSTENTHLFASFDDGHQSRTDDDHEIRWPRFSQSAITGADHLSPTS